MHENSGSTFQFLKDIHEAVQSVLTIQKSFLLILSDYIEIEKIKRNNVMSSLAKNVYKQ